MLDDTLSLLRSGERFVLSTHVRPDGDAIGSQLAFGRFLQAMGKHVTMLNADPAPHNMGWIEGVDDIQVYDGSLAMREAIDAADVVVVLDTGVFARTGTVGEALRYAQGTKLCIDHHPDPEAGFDVLYHRVSASSAGELVFELIMAEDPGLIDETIAQALYSAVVTDTGSFRFSSVSPAVHRMVAELIERGNLQVDVLHSSLYDTRSAVSLRLLGKALDNTTFLHDDRLGYMVISQRLVRSAGADLLDTEGFVNHILSVETVDVALIFSETDSGVKISFRSKGDTAVNGWAAAFGGGGHRNASGAYVKGELDETIRRVLDAAPRHLGWQDDEPALDDADAAYLQALLSRQGG